MLREKLKTWTFLQEKLLQGRSVAFWVVAEDWGSAPGKRGFTLAIAADDTQEGTVGGGIMEHEVHMRSLRLLHSHEEASTILLKRTHHERAPEEERSGMICAGGQWLIGCLLHPKDLSTVEKILHAEKTNVSSAWKIDDTGLSFHETPQTETIFQHHDGHWEYRQPCGQTDTLYVLGGGHVGLAICKQFAPLTFRCEVIDPRHDSLAALHPEFADVVHVKPFEEAEEIVKQGPQSYAVVVTSGFEGDAIALRAIIDKPLRYVGLMGSKRKIHAIFQRLEQEGVSPDLLAKVQAPMGLPIGGQTPAEIAISLAAKIIQVRYSPK